MSLRGRKRDEVTKGTKFDVKTFFEAQKFELQTLHFQPGNRVTEIKPVTMSTPYKDKVSQIQGQRPDLNQRFSDRGAPHPCQFVSVDVNDTLDHLTVSYEPDVLVLDRNTGEMRIAHVEVDPRVVKALGDCFNMLKLSDGSTRALQKKQLDVMVSGFLGMFLYCKQDSSGNLVLTPHALWTKDLDGTLMASCLPVIAAFVRAASAS